MRWTTAPNFAAACAVAASRMAETSSPVSVRSEARKTKVKANDLSIADLVVTIKEGDGLRSSPAPSSAKPPGDQRRSQLRQQSMQHLAPPLALFRQLLERTRRLRE